MYDSKNDSGDDLDNENVYTAVKNKLIPKITISDNTGEVFCCKFSPDGLFLASGCGDGAVRVFNSQTGMLSYNLQGGSNVALPTTALIFRPNDLTGKNFKKNFKENFKENYKENYKENCSDSSKVD